MTLPLQAHATPAPPLIRPMVPVEIARRHLEQMTQQAVNSDMRLYVPQVTDEDSGHGGAGTALLQESEGAMSTGANCGNPCRKNERDLDRKTGLSIAHAARGGRIAPALRRCCPRENVRVS